MSRSWYKGLQVTVRWQQDLLAPAAKGVFTSSYRIGEAGAASEWQHVWGASFQTSDKAVAFGLEMAHRAIDAMEGAAPAADTWFWEIPDERRPGSLRPASPWPLTEAEALALHPAAVRVPDSRQAYRRNESATALSLNSASNASKSTGLR